MNTPAEHVEKTAEHEGLIKTPKQLITTIILAFIIPIAVILLLIRLVTASSPLGSGSDAQSQEAVAKRIQPIASFALVSAEAGTEERTGEQVYAATCSACHTAGIAGAHTLGNEAAWAPILAKGYDALLKNAINGLNAMPPRGGNPALSDLEVARAMVYMTNQSGASFPEPQAEGEGSADEAAADQPASESAAAPAASAETAAESAPAATAANEAGGQPAADAPAAVASASEQTSTTSEATPADAASADAAASDAGNIDLAAGEKLYKSVCFACHSFGVAGAPKTGDKAAWASALAGGMDQMIKVSIDGKGAMPPRGGSTASEEDIIAAVHYMVNQVQ